MPKKIQRARKPEEKEIRRKLILDVARRQLSGDGDIANLSLNEIARKAKMSKANIYRYFETREAVLIEILWSEWQNWYFKFYQQTIQNKNSRPKKSLEHTISAIASTIAEQELLCLLTSVLPTIIEKNLSEDVLTEFKYRSIEFFSKIASDLEALHPEIKSEAWAYFLQDTVTIIVGLYPFSFPNPTLKKVLTNPGLKFFRRNFEGELERYLLALIKKN